MTLGPILAYAFAVVALVVLCWHLLLRYQVARQDKHPSRSVGAWLAHPLVGLGAGVLTLYFSTLGGLLNAWYATDGATAWHWWDDGAEWLGMDKLGHAFTTFWVCQAAFFLIRAHVANQRVAALWAGGLAWFFISSYEAFDGLSPSYGASPQDLVANAVGAIAAGWQLAKSADLKWFPRLSFWPTSWALLRPNVLGSTLSEQMLKDYNGQTYWLNLNPYYLAGLRWWPRWLSITFGYGAEGMVYGRLPQCWAQGYEPWQQLYLSLAWDPSHLVEHNQLWVRRLGRTLRYIQLPLPGGLLQVTPWLMERVGTGLPRFEFAWYF